MLTIIEKEDKWLREIMQNPLSEDSDPHNEDPYDKQMRLKFWDALTRI